MYLHTEKLMKDETNAAKGSRELTAEELEGVVGGSSPFVGGRQFLRFDFRTLPLVQLMCIGAALVVGCGSANDGAAVGESSENITAQQAAVIDFVCKGMTLNEVAHELSISLLRAKVLLDAARHAHVICPRGTPNGQDLVTIHSLFSGKCLDVTGGGTANGTQVEEWHCTGGVAQQWAKAYTENASVFYLVNPHSGKCLDVDTKGNGANGSKIQIWDCQPFVGDMLFFLGAGQRPSDC